MSVEGEVRELRLLCEAAEARIARGGWDDETHRTAWLEWRDGIASRLAALNDEAASAAEGAE